MTVLALTLPLERRSFGRVPRRDLAMGCGDDLVLKVSVAQRDRPDAPLLNLHQLLARIKMRVWREAPAPGCDYGRSRFGAVASSGSAMATAADPTKATITVRAAEPLHWTGGARMGWSLQADVGGAGTALCWGALQIGPDMGIGPFAVLTDDGRPVLADDGRVVLYN